MSEPLTHYGINNASALMSGFHKVGTDSLDALLKYYSAPEERKTLRTWGIREAANLIGRTEQNLRQLERPHGILYPPLKTAKGKRYYTLKRVNQIRDILGTRFKREPGSKPMILAVSNFKGGVAKSTIALHLAQKCALEGLRVLCIDLDPQATLTLGFGYVPDIHLEASDTINSALCESLENIHDLIRTTYFDGISLIPGNLGLADTELGLANARLQEPLIATLGMPHVRLKNALKLIENNYDVIVLDCGPNLGVLTINAVTAANGMLVPIPPMMADFGSYVTFTGTLAALFDAINKEFDFFRILLTKHSGSNEARGVETLMRERFGRYMLINHIVNSVEIEKAAGQFGSVYEMQRISSESYKRAIKSFDNVFAEIVDGFKLIWKSQAIAANNSLLAIDMTA